jgi:hypothetical protein
MALRLGANPLVLLAAAAVLALPWYFVGRTLNDARPAAVSAVAASAIVWGDLVFTAPQPMRHWLHVHGVAYSVWAGRHPDAARVLGPFHKSKKKG